MQLKNRVELIGNLGKDPEIRDFETGKKVANFSVATDDTYTDNKGRKVTETQWHRIVAWDKMAELVEKMLVKGDFVAIEGKLVYRSYEDKEGIKRTMAEIVLDQFWRLTPKE